MADIDTEDLDTVNNNTMSNNNNSINIDNNALLSDLVSASSCVVSQNYAGTPCSHNADSTISSANSPSISGAGVSNTTNSSSNSHSRSTSSRRSRSSARNRSRRHHPQSSGRHGGRHHGHQNHKHRERNFPTALCSMISIVILCTALAEPRWIRIESGHCTLPNYHILNYLGVFQFFYFGDITFSDPNFENKPENIIVEYRYGPGENDRMINCVTERVVMIFKTIIAFTFLAILTSLIGFGLDLVGLEHRLFKLLRRSAIFHIFTVLVCVGVTLFLYWATVDILSLQRQIPNSTARVFFDVSFYLITAAGASSVIAVACSCLHRRILDTDSPSARTILDDQFNEDTENLFAIPQATFHGQDFSPMANLPPPPPYTP